MKICFKNVPSAEAEPEEAAATDEEDEDDDDDDDWNPNLTKISQNIFSGECPYEAEILFGKTVSASLNIMFNEFIWNPCLLELVKFEF